MENYYEPKLNEYVSHFMMNVCAVVKAATEGVTMKINFPYKTTINLIIPGEMKHNSPFRVKCIIFQFKFKIIIILDSKS